MRQGIGRATNSAESVGGGNVFDFEVASGEGARESVGGTAEDEWAERDGIALSDAAELGLTAVEVPRASSVALDVDGKNVFKCFWPDPKRRVFECFWVSLCILDGKIVF